MYFIDFFKRITRKSNIPVLIYLILNVFVIAGIINFVLVNETIPFWQSLLIGLSLYVISLFIALSPVGEWILRLQNGCKKIKRVDQINFIEPIFREVYDKAKRLNQPSRLRSSCLGEERLFMRLLLQKQPSPFMN